MCIRDSLKEYINFEKATVRGFEVSLSGNPFAGFTLNGNYTYAYARGKGEEGGNVGKWRIWMPDGSIRMVQGKKDSGQWITGVAHGKYMLSCCFLYFLMYNKNRERGDICEAER